MKNVQSNSTSYYGRAISAALTWQSFKRLEFFIFVIILKSFLLFENEYLKWDNF